MINHYRDKNGIILSVGDYVMGMMGNHMRGMKSRREKECLFRVQSDYSLEAMDKLPNGYRFHPQLNETRITKKGIKE